MPNTLRIPLTLVLERGCPLDATVEVSTLQPTGAAPLRMDRVRVRGMLEDAGGTFLFRGHVAGTFVSECDRCLAEARMPVDVEATWIFEEGPAVLAEIEEDSDGFDAGEPPERYTFQGTVIDLTPAVWDELALAAPLKYLCRESCAGLCARCGANLNEGPCGCPRDTDGLLPEDGGLADLAALLPKLNAGDNRS